MREYGLGTGFSGDLGLDNEEPLNWHSPVSVFKLEVHSKGGGGRMAIG